MFLRMKNNKIVARLFGIFSDIFEPKEEVELTEIASKYI